MKTTKNHQKLEHRSLVVGLILTFLTGILLFVISKDETISEFEQGLFFIIGLNTMAVLSAFKQYIADLDRTNHFSDEKQDISLTKNIQKIKQKLRKKHQDLQAIIIDYNCDRGLIEIEKSLLEKQQEIFSIEKILLEKEQDNFSIQEKLKEIEINLDYVDATLGQNVPKETDKIKERKVKLN